MRALVGIALAAALAALLLAGAATRRDQAAVPSPFLQTSVGPRDADAPLVREAIPGVRTALDERSFGFERAGESVRLTPADTAGAWTRHADGAVRETPYGSETIVFRGEGGLEQFLTVERRQGPRTWSWQLDAAGLEPRLRVDGSVEFRRSGGTAGLEISPVAILDARGEDVTPDGLRWSLAERDASWWLELELDDTRLPLPYVIDPAITQTGSISASATASPIAFTRPGNVGDLLVAQVAVRSTGAITAPAGWTLLNARSQTNIQQATYWKIATGSESLSWSWAGGGHGAGGVVAYANPHPTTPIDLSTNNSGSSTTASATGGTAAVPAEMIVALYTTVGEATMTQTGSQGVAEVYADGTTTGGAPGTRIRVLASDGVQASSGSVSAKTAALGASGNWVGHLVSIRQAPDDGDGTLTTGTTAVAASSTGNTVTFTYTAGVQGIAGGAVAFDVPASWSAPSLTTTAAGYTTASTGAVGVSGQRVTVTGVTLAPAATMTITYGSTASGGPGATASAATGSVAWSALASGTTTGTLTALAASPSITQVAPDGSGTMTVSPTTIFGGQSTSFVFTYTAATGGMSSGAVRVTIPSGWTAPNTASGTSGYTTSSTGTVGVSGQVITVTGVTLAAAGTMTVTYGSGAGGAVTVPAGSGTVTWQTQQGSLSTSTLTNLAVSPTSTYNAPPTATVSLSPSPPTTNQTLTATATKDDAEGDPVTLDYVWKVDGVTVKTTLDSGSLTDTLDLSVGGNGDKSQAVSVEVTPNDGVQDGSTVSDSETVANSAPTISSVAIDQGSPTTNQILSVTVVSADADGDARTYSYQWRRNGTDLVGETNATLDLSVAGNGDKGDELTVEVVANDGTASSAPATSAAVTVANSAPTISSVTIDQGLPTTNQILSVTVVSADADGDPRSYSYQWRKNGTDLTGETNATLDLSLAGNGDKGDQITVEVVANDGSANSAPSLSAAVTVANSAPTISSVTIDQAAPTTNQILSVTVVSADADGDARSYSYQWRKNGTDLAGETNATLDLSVAGNGDKDDQITVEVIANDGTASSAPATSAAVTVANSAPTISSVTIDQGSPKTNDTLTNTVTSADADGDAVTLTYQWKRNGVDRLAETAATFDLSLIGNGDKGDQITVEVIANDGSANSAPSLSAAVTVANSAPVLSAVSIDQAAPETNDTLTATITATDADGDTITPTRQWRKNTVDLTGETAAGLDLSVAGNGDKGDQIALRVSVSDGTDSDGPLTSSAVTIANSAPTISSVTIDQAAPTTNQILSVTVASADADNDPRTYSYQWKKNGTNLTGATSATLDLSAAGNGDKDDQITVQVIANDGTANSTPTTSAAVTVANSAPTMSSVTIDQGSPTTNQILSVTVVSADADSDPRTYTYQWKKNGTDLTGATNATLDLSVAGNGDKGDQITVEVIANDGTANSTPSTSAAVTIANSAPTATVSLSPASPATDDVLTATASAADPDDDTVTLDYVWKVDGVTVKTNAGSSSLTDTLDLAVAGNGDGGDTVSVEVTPHDGTAAGTLVTDSVVVDFVADRLAFTSSTADLASGAQRTLTVEVRDADGALVADDSTTQVTFAKTVGAGTVSGLGTATAVNGVVSLVVEGVLAGAITIEATAAGLAADSTSLTVVHGAATALDFTLSGSDTSGATKTLTATIEDAAGNTVTGDSSTVVTFAQTGGAGTVGGLGSDTAAAGVATIDVTNELAGQVDLQATAAGLTADTASYTVSAGSASTSTSTIDASPATIVANGSSTSTITVQLKDAAGNDLATSDGVVALSLTGAGTLGPVTDNGDGTYTATLTSPTATGTATITGTLNAVALADTASVTYAHGPATALQLTDSGSTTAGDSHTLTATIVDANGNTVTSDSSTVVTFAQTGGTGTLSGLGTATAASGAATKTVVNRLAGQVDVAATASGLTAGTTSWTIVTGSVSAAESSVTASPTSVLNDGTDSTTITVTVRDGGGNPLAGKTVVLDDNGASAVITVVDDTTDAAGVATFTATNTVGEPVVFDATADAVAITDTATVNFVFDDTTAPTNTITLASATGAHLSGTTLYYRPSAAGSFTLSSAVADTGSGPDSATYPLVTQPSWTHALETVDTPDGGPYVSSPFTWTNAAAGDFDVVVTAADAWSPPNTSDTTLSVTEDSTAPAASIECESAACPAGWFTSSPVSITLAAPDGGAGLDLIRYTVDGTEPTLFTGNVYMGAFDVAAEGVTTVKFRAFDRVGNDSGVQSQAVRIDTVAPETTIDSAPAAATQDTTPTFAFSSDEAGSTFEYRLDGGSWTTGATSPVTLGPLAENTYTFEVRARDVAGNIDGSPASFVFTVDTTPADTTISPVPPALTNSTSATFSFTASDAGPSFECSLDGGSFGACTSPQSYAGLSEGAHTFEVRAKDAAGNLDATPASHAWTVDLTAPVTSFLSTPSDPSANTTPTFGLGSSESPSTFECNLDAGGWSACATPFTTPVLGDGSHTLELRATDATGNTDATPVSYTWLVDATAPTGNVTAPTNGAEVSGEVALASDSADTGSGVATIVFERRLGAGAWTATLDLWDTTDVADGEYDLRVVTTDDAGNAFTSAAITVTVDNTAPDLTVVAPTVVNVDSPDPESIAATATDDGTGVASVNFEQCSAANDDTCAVDTWTPLGLDTTFPYGVGWPVPTDGTRLLRVRATDNAGKQTTDTVLVTVDRTRPSGAVTAPAAGANLRGTSVALAATASDTAPGTVNTVTFQTSPAGADTWTPVDTDPSEPYTATLDTTGLAGDGLYDLRVFTTDAAGNAEQNPATIQVRVDNTAPTGDVTFPADAANVRGTVGLTSDSADGGSGVATVAFERSPAGAGTWTAQPASFDTTGVADGLYDLRVTTTDNAGNAFTSAAITVRVDNTPPTGAVTGPAAGANVRATIALASDSADAGSGVATIQFQRSPSGAGTWTAQAASWDTTLQADGLYDLRVVTTDNAGNSFTSPAITIRVDNTAPTGSVTAPAGGSEHGTAPVALGSDSADAGSGVASVVFERSLAGADTWAAVPASWDTVTGPDAVADGSYDLRVTTTDNAGNAFSSPIVTVLVDHTAPTTTAGLAPASPSNAPVTVSFSADDGAGSGVSVTSYRVDGGSLQFGSSVIVDAPGDHSNDGSHLVEFFSTDEVGNIEATKSVTVVIDTTAPSGTGGDPGDYLRGLANLTYSTADSDVSSVQFEFSPAGMNAWSAVGAADIAPPYEASWNTTLVADGEYDLRAVVTDTVGNVAAELLPGLPKTVDNTAPSGSVTSPAAAAFVSGSVNVTASATDGPAPPASGVAAVRFEIKPAGSGSFTVFGTQTVPVVGSTYQQSLSTGSYADGPAELQVVVTDVAGNELTSATRTINIDNLAPTVTLDDPGPAVSGTPTLSATAAADTAQVLFERSPAGANTWAAISTDSTPIDGFTAAWATGALADGLYDLRATATDGGSNSTTSSTRTTRVDNTLPTGSVTAPAGGAIVGGPGVELAAAAADTGGSGVVSVAFEVKVFGSGVFDAVGSDTSAPFGVTWDATGAPDGAAEIRALITDAAGNVRQTAVVPVTVDSTGPSVTLTDPGSVLSGPVAVSATTGGGAVRVEFGVSPADAGTWTLVGEDTSAPFGVPLDTAAFADGLYDLRAVGYDSLGNPSAASILEDVRFDNTAPALVSSAPADGSVSVSANQIVLTASEPVTAPGALLDGAAAPVPVIAGNQLTFATGALADGLHVLSGELEDASGTRRPFRVAVTIESVAGADRPPVELSARPDQASTLTAPSGLASVTVTPAAWPSLPSAWDFMVLRVDLAPPAPIVGTGLLPGTQVVEVTARWALAGTPVTQFEAPIDIVIPNPSGEAIVPAISQDGSTWRVLSPVAGSLPAGQADGWYRDGAGAVHILTRHLTWFALLRDNEAPTAPRHLAGVVAEDGLTLRWIPGSDSSGQLGNVVLFVNGEPYQNFETTQLETKLGPVEPGDTRRFTLVQLDAAGNASAHTAPLRALPLLAGKSLEQASAELAAAGFRVGQVTETLIPGSVTGTVVEPAGIRFATEASAVDLVVAIATGVPQTRLVFAVAGAKSLKLAKRTQIPVRISVSKPANVTATLFGADTKRLYSWRLKVKAGANVVKLTLPPQIRRPGTYTLTWVARSGTETVRRTVKVKLVGPKLAQVKPKKQEIEIVLAGETPQKGALQPGLKGTGTRVVATADPERTFALVASTGRDVGIVVVDVDAYGVGFVRDLRTVFPTLRLIALSRTPLLRAQAVRAGAVLALPRNVTATQLAKAIAKISSG